MFGTIIKREFIDHVVSFRFVAVFALTMFLTVTSVRVSSVDYEQQLRAYQGIPGGVEDENGKVSLMMLPCRAWGVHRSPSRLLFLAGQAEWELPNRVTTSLHSLQSVDRDPEMGEALAGTIRSGWGAAVGLLLSFAAGLLTYKSISGELRDGTLTLVLSNPLSKGTLLAAKYVAALLALALAFLVAVAAGLLVVLATGSMALTADDWLKVGLFVFASLVYCSIFVLLGLLCSVIARSPVISAVAFLLNWTVLVFVVPNIGGVLAGFVGRVPSPLEVKSMAAAIDERTPLRPGASAAEYAAVQNNRQKAGEELLREYVQSLLRQVDLGRRLTRISPVSTYEYAVEGIAGVGTSRLERFIDNVVRYRARLFESAVAADKDDPESEHRYVPWNCGSNNFSRKTVSLRPATEFQDPPLASGEGLVNAAWDVLLLCIYNLLLFAAAFWRFAVRDVAPTPGV
jgi:ABC-type transport system involved in multi-copper enzyme maturation permease subunit